MTNLETLTGINYNSNLDNSLSEGGRQEEFGATIQQYFKGLNEGEFELVSELFAPFGELRPPFEEPVVGPEAIAAYLQAEAKGMKLYPGAEFRESVEGGNRHFEIRGQVETAFFKVNVAWFFVLNAAAEILSVRVKLLASLKELVNLRR
ncbi:nuclear transport factor 2 family protein [Laspinema olomoucense]|uniref:Nuclear transport factor 2 family protein n=1 Tax=Laspinema olomoucense D3b TaxID=2953688 RepID=A0ABT2N6Y0_9CYAN|nr:MULTISPECIES: nuclear transport factor 2 family protein [unclassified Laspinema]MCT7974040.1 nuclear transport factor 2 family protein [Laspinema sp. D3d]MCT7978446.1 nuclear transport factor 2 family protein [Laspinema sp. D3b]